MRLDRNQTEKVSKSLSKIGLDYKELADDLLDHVCCQIETHMEKGNSFETSFKKVLFNFTPSKIQQIQSSTLSILQMERFFSYRISALSTIPLILIGIMWISGDFLKFLPSMIHQFFFWSSFFSMLFLFGLGWIKEFPRWSIPSIGYCILISIIFMNVTSLPSLPKNVIGIWALVPLLLTLCVSIILNPSVKPLISLYKKFIDDKSILLLSLIGFIPFAAWMSFDGMYKLSVLPQVILINLIIIISVFIYLSSHRRITRYVSIFTGLLATFVISLISSILS